MAKFKNLKVVVSGQFGNGAEYKYGYPIAPTADDPQNNWLKMDMVEKDPLDVGNYFKDITYPIYKMRVSIYGTYYALVAPCKYDTSGRKGYYSITLFIAKGTKYTGAQVRATLNNLNEILYDVKIVCVVWLLGILLCLYSIYDLMHCVKTVVETKEG